MVDRISSLDKGYEPGDLSLFPQALDGKDTLYEATNNADTVLKQTLSYNGNFVVVDNNDLFPTSGLVRIDNELIYYQEKTSGIFKGLVRGFAGSKQNRHNIGSKVSHSVMAEHHNAIKDALINLQTYLGTKDNPAEGSLNGRLTNLERKYLSPKPTFRAYPRTGGSNVKVRFQNFTNPDPVRFLWDFGDGAYSTEHSPIHEYLTEGDYTVQLRIVTSSGGTGVVTKKNYIKIRDDKGFGFAYVTPESGSTLTTFNFVDQTDGDIIQRHWSFDDGTRITVDDPDDHSITHTYEEAGIYNPTLLVIFSDQSLKKVNLPDSIVVT